MQARESNLHSGKGCQYRSANQVGRLLKAAYYKYYLTLFACENRIDKSQQSVALSYLL